MIKLNMGRADVHEQSLAFTIDQRLFMIRHAIYWLSRLPARKPIRNAALLFKAWRDIRDWGEVGSCSLQG
jgi:hypothetical protein